MGLELREVLRVKVRLTVTEEVLETLGEFDGDLVLLLVTELETQPVEVREGEPVPVVQREGLRELDGEAVNEEEKVATDGVLDAERVWDRDPVNVTEKESEVDPHKDPDAVGV